MRALARPVTLTLSLTISRDLVVSGTCPLLALGSSDLALQEGCSWHGGVWAAESCINTKCLGQEV
jgi:hypothetical protein